MVRWPTWAAQLNLNGRQGRSPRPPTRPPPGCRFQICGFKQAVSRRGRGWPSASAALRTPHAFLSYRTPGGMPTTRPPTARQTKITHGISRPGASVRLRGQNWAGYRFRPPESLWPETLTPYGRWLSTVAGDLDPTMPSKRSRSCVTVYKQAAMPQRIDEDHQASNFNKHSPLEKPPQSSSPVQHGVQAQRQLHHE